MLILFPGRRRKGRDVQPSTFPDSSAHPGFLLDLKRSSCDRSLPVLQSSHRSQTSAYTLGAALHEDKTSNCHQPRFPLSADHLILLIQFNLYRAALENMSILSLPGIFSCDEHEPSMPGLYISALPLRKAVPPSLWPTYLQRHVPHYAWIDLFPTPAIRDNLIRTAGTFDTCEFCDDMVGALVENNALDDERNGMIIWGEPWDVNSWEFTEGFAKKWGWLLDGCEELVTATNRWRAIRGEDPFSPTMLGLASSARSSHPR